MKLLLSIFCCFIFTIAAYAQDDNTHDISGTWYGVFSNYMGEKQRLLVVLEKNKRGYAGQLKSPDKTQVSLPLDSVDYTSGMLRFRVNEIGLSYKGGWDAANKRFNGYLVQSGDQFPLNISKDEITKEALYRRPQDPQPPFNYRQEDVIFSSRDQDIAIAGTFTRPADSTLRYPVVILLSDGGPQDRNSEMVGHRPFAVIADQLTRRGIAVLRCDDRGVGGSGGNYDDATLEDQADDVRAAITYLQQRKDVDPAQIGLLGHGKGMAVAAIAAADNDSLAFLVSMAGAGLPLRQQQEGYLVQTLAAIQPGIPDSTVQRFLKAAQPWFNLLATEKDEDKLQQEGKPYLQALYRQFSTLSLRMPEQVFVDGMLAVQTTPNMLSTFRFDPPAWLARVKCPVLAINGAKDLAVDADLNLDAIQNALLKGGNQQVTVRSFEGLNHLFQQCKTCVVNEYGALDQTIDPAALEFLGRWIVVIVNRADK